MFAQKQNNSVYHPRLMAFCCAVYELNAVTTPKLLNNSVKCFTTSSSPASGPIAYVYLLFYLINSVKQVCPNGSIYMIHILATPIPQKRLSGPVVVLLHKPGRTFGP